MFVYIEKVLNDAVLGFLALLSLFLLITPLVFSLSNTGLQVLLVIEYLIIALFALEYLAGFRLAKNKREFMLNRWRIIDALIIVLALITFFPIIPDLLRNSPALRLLRLGRVALLGTRSSVALKPVSEKSESFLSNVPAEVSVMALGKSGKKFEKISWQTALSRIGNAEQDWLFISGVTQDKLESVASALGVPETALQGIFQSNVPRFGRLEKFSTLFIRYPLKLLPGERLHRTPVLLVGTAENVVVLCRERTDLEHHVEERLQELDDNTPRMVRAMIALVGEIVRAYTDVLENLETSLLQFEVEQSGLSDEKFLTHSFSLRTDIIKVRSSLKNLKSVIVELSHGQLSIPGSDEDDRRFFGLIASDVSDLYEGIEDTRESLQVLVDLRLNVSSFQMNRVMRLLALLTALALIPATAGGLLGMNLLDAPWPATLAQVAFGVAVGMALSLYIFIIKGWLR